MQKSAFTGPHEIGHPDELRKAVSAVHQIPLPDGMLVKVRVQAERIRGIGRLVDYVEIEGYRYPQPKHGGLIFTNWMSFGLECTTWHYGQQVDQKQVGHSYEFATPSTLWGKRMFRLGDVSIGDKLITIGVSGRGAVLSEYYLSTRENVRRQRKVELYQAVNTRKLLNGEAAMLNRRKKFRHYYPREVVVSLG